MVQEQEQTQDFSKIGVGTKDKPKIKPGKVTIAGIDFQVETKEHKKMKSPLAIFTVKHPEVEDTLRISKVKFIENDKVKVVGLWCNLDEDGNFQKGSAVATVMNFLKIESLSEAVGKEIEAVEQSETEAYLCLKAY